MPGRTTTCATPPTSRILEGQALAVARADGEVTLYLDSPLEVDRAEVDCPASSVVHAPDLDRRGRRGAATACATSASAARPSGCCRAGIAARAKDLNLADETAVLDRLLMGKLDSEIDAMRRAAKLADDGYAVFRQAARVGRADYELVAEIEAFFRAHGVDDNFQIIGVGGPEVRGMAPPERQAAQARRYGHHRAHALRRRLLRADLPHAGRRRGQRRAAGRRTRSVARRWRRASRPCATASQRPTSRAPRTTCSAAHGLGDYITSEYTRVRGHGMGLFADTKPHILEDVTTRIDAGMTLIVHPNTYHPVVGYMVLGDASW